MIIPVKWISCAIQTTENALKCLGRAKHGVEPITTRCGSSTLVSEKRFPWDESDTARLLCVFIVRMKRVFHGVLLINLMDKPGIFNDFAVVGLVKVAFWPSGTDVSKPTKEYDVVVKHWSSMQG